MPLRSRADSKFYSEQVVEAVLQIMEQGPQPMRNLKPAKKNPNGADHFESEHQSPEGYEKEDRAGQVDGHNAAYPKMRDELDRRRSTAKPTAPSVTVAKRKAPNQTYYDPRCRACQKLKMAESKKRNSKTKTEKKRKSRVTKKRPQRRGKSTFKLARLRTNKGCQYCSQYTNRGTSADLYGDATKMADNIGEVIYFSNRNQEQRSSKAGFSNNSGSQNASKSVISQNPDTSANSLSSYNSNMSLDHEPMVPR